MWYWFSAHARHWVEHGTCESCADVLHKKKNRSAKENPPDACHCHGILYGKRGGGGEGIAYLHPNAVAQDWSLGGWVQPRWCGASLVSLGMSNFQCLENSDTVTETVVEVLTEVCPTCRVGLRLRLPSATGGWPGPVLVCDTPQPPAPPLPPPRVLRDSGVGAMAPTAPKFFGACFPFIKPSMF